MNLPTRNFCANRLPDYRKERGVKESYKQVKYWSNNSTLLSGNKAPSDRITRGFVNLYLLNKPEDHAKDIVNHAIPDFTSVGYLLPALHCCYLRTPLDTMFWYQRKKVSLCCCLLALANSGNFIRKAKQPKVSVLTSALKPTKIKLLSLVCHSCHLECVIWYLSTTSKLFSLTMHRWQRKEMSLQVAHTALESSLNRQCIYHRRPKLMILKLSM